MPHFPKPFSRPARGLWYVQLGGRQVNLGPDQAAAFKTYHNLMARPDEVARRVRVAPVRAEAYDRWGERG